MFFQQCPICGTQKSIGEHNNNYKTIMPGQRHRAIVDPFAVKVQQQNQKVFETYCGAQRATLISTVERNVQPSSVATTTTTTT
jgi:hypothetical protein